MTNRFNSIIEALSKSGFVDSTDDSHSKKLDFKITEYNLNTDLSFKFENVEDFKNFLKSRKTEINEERIENALNDLNIDANSFFYVNFFDQENSNKQ